MTLHRGQDLILSISDGAGGFDLVGGLRTRNVALRADAIVSNHVESGLWRQLHSGGGAKQATVSGNGLFVDDVAAQRVRSQFFSGTFASWRIGFPDAALMTGDFQITALDLSGAIGGEAGFSITLASAGQLTFQSGAAV